MQTRRKFNFLGPTQVCERGKKSNCNHAVLLKGRARALSQVFKSILAKAIDGPQMFCKRELLYKFYVTGFKTVLEYVVF